MTHIMMTNKTDVIELENIYNMEFELLYLLFWRTFGSIKVKSSAATCCKPFHLYELGKVLCWPEA